MTKEDFPCANEFRSDTFTVPTASMIQSVALASVGDSVYAEDLDTLNLEEKVAQMADKEAGLFCVSGTLSNQIGLRSHLMQPPHRILCDSRAHVYMHEAGGLATLSQAMVTPVTPRNGLYLTLEDVVDNYIPDDGDIHMAPTKVVSLENTIHGIITPLEEIARISEWCRENDVRLHCDGARLWNASVETNTPLSEYGKLFDSISLCLSKSLGSPMGSVLVGDRKFIDKANHFKKQNGGGIRQSGFIARMASIAIDENLGKLRQSHEYAKDVARFLQDNGVPLECPTHTNFVFVDQKKARIDPDHLVAMGEKYNVNIMGTRFAFHFQNSKEAVERLKQAIMETFKYSQEHPYVSTGAKRLYTSKSRSNSPVLKN
ncbi:Threonine aldolase [Komagataella phaffii CBS 7435]|uniref:low-specificity L-threonine aldolase n=2 Tax=Komagataella phaffii TaxID=460519 RepID=C4R6W2_KOMPG|nr:Threonine aldolase [Komagataella phaffii GS115]AOA64699.1 GQ67_04420T0 [Komagataella phaffii]KAI0461518.1 Threonine aldolase [Komagataella kurtzmanii]CAH2451318.1 Threonine aldolase [Komagataella phaffii CBS 7435]AOA69900.1 GQ68_04392T0 [Komagataella phaffii GS115]CAY71337.1 Threonine aldolase [Komagataella phaffii GS115]